MTQTQEAPTFPDLSDVPVHMVCRTCWPHPVPEQLAVCGEKPATIAMDPMPDPFRPFCGHCKSHYELRLPCHFCGSVPE